MNKINRQQQVTLWFIIFCMCAIFGGFGVGCKNRHHNKSASESAGSIDTTLFEITGDWQYRWGDSPFDANGVPVWTYKNVETAEWQPVTYYAGVTNPLNRHNSEILWLCVILPDLELRDPQLYVQFVRFACDVYLDNKLVYSFKRVNVPGQGKFTEDPFHLIPLDNDFQNKSIYFRIYSQDPSFVGVGKVAVGSHADIIHDILIKDAISSLILGFLFISIGFIPLVLFIIRRKDKSYFAFGLFCLSVGFWTLNNTHFWQHLFDAPRFWFYLSSPWPFVTGVGICAFFEHIFGPGWRSIIRRLWQFILGYAIIGLFCLFTCLLNMRILMMIQMFYLALLGIVMLILFATSIHAAINGNKDARIITIGIALFSVFAIYDILGGAFRLLPWSQNTYPWGMFLFILSLGFVLERRFQRYASELEESNIKLQDYSQTLEQKVEERTRELKEAQDQLILKEKMSSLGNLVAGVAHEVNTPIGAVYSSADVARRCIEKIKGILYSKKPVKKSKEQLDRYLKILEDNNNVTATASERIANIVKSMKTFARLDETEYQKADLHEGLDTTLTLINHELKNRITVTKNYGNIPEINCHPNQLNQVFMNILINAVQAIEEQGKITIETLLQENKVAIKISDTGGGIPAENMTKIFNPGFTTRGVGVGTGLGLSISYNIIQKHNGDIKVESKVGEGTTFTILLPIDDEGG